MLLFIVSGEINNVEQQEDSPTEVSLTTRVKLRDYFEYEVTL